MAKSLQVLFWHDEPDWDDESDSFCIRLLKEQRKQNFRHLQLSFWSETDVNQHTGPRFMRQFENELDQADIIVFLLGQRYARSEYHKHTKLLKLFDGAKARGARLVAARTYLASFPSHPLFKKCERFQEKGPAFCDDEDDVVRPNIDELLSFLSPEGEEVPPSSVFISYAWEDESFADRIKLNLDKVAGNPNSLEPTLNFWRDISLKPGDNWRDELIRQLDGARVVLLVLTPNAVASTEVNHEISYALGAGKEVIPLRILESEDRENPVKPHTAISSKQYIHINEMKYHNWADVYQRIQEKISD